MFRVGQNAASSTLTDSYVTPKEAQRNSKPNKARIEEKIAGRKKLGFGFEKKSRKGRLTAEQAKNIERSKAGYRLKSVSNWKKSTKFRPTLLKRSNHLIPTVAAWRKFKLAKTQWWFFGQR